MAKKDSLKKFYWLKLKEEFFEDDTINFIEEQENGKEYLLFYLKLCLKSLKKDGHLYRLIGNEVIPYDVSSLASLTKTNVDTVNSAMVLFKKIGVIDVLDTGMLYMSQINEMIGSETNKAQLMRDKRARDKLLINECSNNVTQNSNNVTECYHDVTQPLLQIEKEIERDTEKEIKIKKEPFGSVFKKLEVSEYLKNTLIDFIAMRKNIKAPMTQRALELSINKLRKMSVSESTQIEIVNQSIMNSWKGLFELKQSTSNPNVINTSFGSNETWDRIAKEIEEKERLNAQ